MKLRIYRGSAKATDSFRDLNLSFNYSCGLLRLRVKSDWSQNTINIPEVLLRRSWFYRFHCNKVQAFLSFTHDLVQASLRNLTTKAVSQTNHVCVCYMIFSIIKHPDLDDLCLTSWFTHYETLKPTFCSVFANTHCLL